MAQAEPVEYLDLTAERNIIVHEQFDDLVDGYQGYDPEGDFI